ncbi:heme-binding protein [Halobacterium salinarum]|uniref:heme-binding protein n=1 Tax=Halobacterium salinarum TaxID=2242 RepID=UPI001F3C1276|nr:heme-binding protein [Halobacterium salinarum]MCF2206652.1 heme-binding protein [Halobacterium salinarum]MCF2241076.1 heme-binding protein [Halobacterium salinarum]
MADAPPTDEGWFVLHDCYTVDWDAWRDAPERDRTAALDDAASFLADREALADADEGESGVFSITGQKADLLFVHFRESLDELDRIQRAFEQTAFAEYTERAHSYVSVVEISGYTAPDYFEDPDSVDDGLRQYFESKLTPEIPDDTYVSFYPMSKRRQPEQNWYDLPIEERAEMMDVHGDLGKQYAGRVSQVIASSVGLDDMEWGVTLFADDLTDIKDIVYEMRFDEVSAKYGAFGDFFVGRRFPPADLPAFMAGERVPAPEGGADAHGEGERTHHHGDSDHHDGDDGEQHHHSTGDEADDGIRGELADEDIYAGQPHGEDVYATVLYSEAGADDLFEEVEGLRGNFEHYDTHVKTAVYDGHEADRRAVVSIWDTASAADTAAGFLADLPEVVERAGEESGFGTMGMFYETKPEHTAEFVEKFDTVAGVLADMDGHFDTDLMVNVENDDDMFIASQWRSQEDAMAFFRSDDFGDTVDWGRDVLADRPRHVFLA